MIVAIVVNAKPKAEFDHQKVIFRVDISSVEMSGICVRPDPVLQSTTALYIQSFLSDTH